MRKLLGNLMAVGIAVTSIALPTTTVRSATVEENTPIKEIKLAHGRGVTISLVDGKSIIKTVWVDNPTFTNLSFDKCVAGFNNCKISNATRAHIRRNEDLRLKGFPPASNTLITIISENTETKTQEVHLFSVSKGNTSSNPTISVMPKASKAIAKQPEPVILSASGLPPAELAEKVTAVLANPIVKTEIEPATRKRLKVFANLLVLGTPEYQAMNQAGVAPERIQEIVRF